MPKNFIPCWWWDSTPLNILAFLSLQQRMSGRKDLVCLLVSVLHFGVGMAEQLCLLIETREDGVEKREERWPPGPTSGPMTSGSESQKASS